LPLYFSGLVAITICEKVPLIRSWTPRQGLLEWGITPEPERWEVVAEGGRVLGGCLYPLKAMIDEA
jgi:hypothetical protein